MVPGQGELEITVKNLVNPNTLKVLTPSNNFMNIQNLQGILPIKNKHIKRGITVKIDQEERQKQVRALGKLILPKALRKLFK